jgi:signal peptidase II
MSKVRVYLGLVGSAGLVIAVDQLTKYLVRSRLDLGGSWSPIPAFGDWVRVVHWTNTGAAFGLFPSGGLVFTVVAIVVSAAILYYYPRIPTGHALLRLALILQLGGALGNLADRLIQATVTDFIAVGHFPVFNVADACISIGVALLVISMWLDERGAADVGRESEGGPTEAAERPPVSPT